MPVRLMTPSVVKLPDGIDVDGVVERPNAMAVEVASSGGIVSVLVVVSGR